MGKLFGFVVGEIVVDGCVLFVVICEEKNKCYVEVWVCKDDGVELLKLIELIGFKIDLCVICFVDVD